MDKPEALKELIEELRDDGVTSDIESEPGAYAMVKWDGDEVRLTASDAKMLLSDENNIEEMLDALNLSNFDAHIEFSGLTIPDSNMETLMDHFQTVDEV